jgi:hypothetical protein
MKDFNEKAIEITNDKRCEVYDFEGYRIAIEWDIANHRYYTVLVDGKTIATRALRGNGVKFALKYINEQ